MPGAGGKKVSKGTQGPFGQATRMRVLEGYWANAGEITAENAWEHVYRCLLWMNIGAGLAHIYDSNHMQVGGVWHERAVRFTDLLCKHWNVSRKQLGDEIDYLFKGCVAEFKRTTKQVVDPEAESELLLELGKILAEAKIPVDRIQPLARKVEEVSKDFFTIGKKRMNALGEGFEDLLYLLLRRVSRVPDEKIALRRPVSKLPGFRNVPRLPGRRGEKEPHPDIAIIEPEITRVVTTAKWSMRQDRQSQFQPEYTAYQLNRLQKTELRFKLITNEFDRARLHNVADAIPEGRGGYIFHDIYHINPDLLVQTHGDKIGNLQHWIGVGKIRSLADFLNEMALEFGPKN